MERPARPHWTAVILGVAVGVSLVFGGILVDGGGLAAHKICAASQSETSSFQAWVPVVMENSPYGGIVWANGTVPMGALAYPAGYSNGYEIGVKNGSAAWAGFGGEFNVTPVENQTEFGPGANTPCAAPFSVSVSYWGGTVLGGPLLGQGNRSDANETGTLNATIPPSTEQLGISNRFLSANGPSVSTCGTNAKSEWVNSTALSVTVPVTTGQLVLEQPFTFQFQENFHYLFPGNFGTWEVDNLTAPGGPGGGWAFSYLPCAR